MATLTRVEAANHTPEGVRAIIKEAVEIADEMELLDHRWQPVFIQACQLLGQKAVTFVAEPDVSPAVQAMLRH